MLQFCLALLSARERAFSFFPSFVKINFCNGWKFFGKPSTPPFAPAHLSTLPRRMTSSDLHGFRHTVEVDGRRREEYINRYIRAVYVSTRFYNSG